MQSVVTNKLKDIVQYLLTKWQCWTEDCLHLLPFTEGSMLSLKKQSGFTIFPLMCCYSGIDVSVVAASYLLADDFESHKSDIEEQCDCVTHLHRQKELRRGWHTSGGIYGYLLMSHLRQSHPKPTI